MPDQVSGANKQPVNPFLVDGSQGAEPVNPTPAPIRNEPADAVGTTAASGGVSPNQASVAGDNLLSLREQLLAWTKSVPNAEAVLADGRKQLDRTNPDSASSYASQAQRAAAAVAEKMLNGVRVKDTGAGTSEILQNAMSTMKGFDTKIDPKDNSFWDKLVAFVRGQKWGLERAITRYTTEQGEVLKVLQKLSDDLTHKKLEHETDILALGELRDATLQSFETLGHRISAGHVELEEARRELAEVNQKVLADPQNPELLGKQNTLRQYTDLLDRRLHALAKAFAFARQQIPGIEAMQKNSRDLRRGIMTFQDQVLPTWKQVLAQATVLARQERDADVLAALDSYGDQLLITNAEQLHDVSIRIAEQVQKGIGSIDALTRYNELMIDMVGKIAEIERNGRAQRAAGEAQLVKNNQALSKALAEANKVA